MRHTINLMTSPAERERPWLEPGRWGARWDAMMRGWQKCWQAAGVSNSNLSAVLSLTSAPGDTQMMTKAERRWLRRPKLTSRPDETPMLTKGWEEVILGAPMNRLLSHKSLSFGAPRWQKSAQLNNAKTADFCVWRAERGGWATWVEAARARL
jgi:hypothetical protein